MHYFIFNNDVFMSDGEEIKRLSGEDQKTFAFDNVHTAHVCIVETEVVEAVAPEERPEQKDIILTKVFSKDHAGEYIIQGERIGPNRFQVVGVKAEKVRDIYKRLPGNKIVAFTPYAMAVRAFLNVQNLEFDGVVVFVDDLGGETLITFYEGLKFSPTRRFTERDIEKIYSEIKRSAIGFSRKEKYIVVTNNKVWVDLMKKTDPDQQIRYVDALCPAIEGLKKAHFPLKFELPEEVLRRSKEKALKAKIPYFVLAGTVVVLGALFVLFYKMNLVIQTEAYKQAGATRDSLEVKLGDLDPKIYRSEIKNHKKVNYGDIYFWLQTVIPQSYEVDSLKFVMKEGREYLEIVLFLQKGQPFEDIPVRKPFTKMIVQNVLIKERPGKSIRIEL